MSVVWCSASESQAVATGVPLVVSVAAVRSCTLYVLSVVDFNRQRNAMRCKSTYDIGGQVKSIGGLPGCQTYADHNVSDRLGKPEPTFFRHDRQEGMNMLLCVLGIGQIRTQ